MTIVYDDIIYSLQQAGGISEVFSQTSKYMAGDILHYIYDNVQKNLQYHRIKEQKYITLSSKYLCIKRFFNLSPKRKGAYIFHSSYYRLSNDRDAINITTVHDFMYELYRHDIKSILHKKQKRKAVLGSDGIICISENSKRDLLKLYPSFNKPIAVIYNGYDDETYVFKNLQRKKQIVYTGGRKGYKDFKLAVRIVKELKDYLFIIAGGGELSREELEMLSGMNYIKYGFLSNEELSGIYNTSFLLLYTSEYEGFGITPLEAQACGCMVACQMTSSLPEVVGNTAIPIDPSNIERTAAAIREYEAHEKYTKGQRAGLDNTKRFSWKKTAEEYLRFYERINNMRQNTEEDANSD